MVSKISRNKIHLCYYNIDFLFTIASFGRRPAQRHQEIAQQRHLKQHVHQKRVHRFVRGMLLERQHEGLRHAVHSQTQQQKNRVKNVKKQPSALQNLNNKHYRGFE